MKASEIKEINGWFSIEDIIRFLSNRPAKKTIDNKVTPFMKSWLSIFSKNIDEAIFLNRDGVIGLIVSLNAPEKRCKEIIQYINSVTNTKAQNSDGTISRIENLEDVAIQNVKLFSTLTEILKDKGELKEDAIKNKSVLTIRSESLSRKPQKQKKDDFNTILDSAEAHSDKPWLRGAKDIINKKKEKRIE